MVDTLSAKYMPRLTCAEEQSKQTITVTTMQ